MGILQTYPHIFRALESNLGIHSNTALHHCKQEAMDRLTAMGMPTRKWIGGDIPSPAILCK